MKINIYYGGRGLVGDPTLYTVRCMIKVFEELNVKVEKYDLFDQKTNTLATLPQTLKDADGIILASTVEWHGVGGNMMSFLDACWLYGDKEKISTLYMAPVIMATAYGEKEAELDLTSAWQSLGGRTCLGLCGYVPEVSELEQNDAYQKLIEKSAENIYRCINQKQIALPVSVMAVSQIAYKTRNTTLTQQETEQLSEYASDEAYVKKQKEDIRELADLFMGQLKAADHKEDKCSENFRKAFKGQRDISLNCKIKLSDKPRPLSLRIMGLDIEIDYSDMPNADLELTLDTEILEEILSGRRTFQRGFMDGSILVKGDFKNLQAMDVLFPAGG